jgi:RND family efflux transporter MFP subunit
MAEAMTLRIRTVLLAALALMASAVTVAAAPPDVVDVRVDAVLIENLADTVPVVSRLVPLRSGSIATREAGRVSESLVEVGDRVSAGAVLVRLNADRLQAERALRAAVVAAAEASINVARAEAALTRQELARLEALRRSPAFSEAAFNDKRQEVSIAEARVAEAEAGLAEARADLRLAEIALSDGEIKAPYPGVITRRMATEGAHLSVGDAVVAMIDDRRLEVEADVPTQHIGGLAAETAVTFEVQGRTLSARVRAIVPEENSLTRTRTVRFVPDLTGIAELAANQSVTLHVPSGRLRSAPTVHKDAVLHRSGGTFVVRVVDGRAEIRPVRLGESTGPRFEVVDGLVSGDVVVIRGNERLLPGQALRFDGGAGG